MCSDQLRCRGSERPVGRDRNRRPVGRRCYHGPEEHQRDRDYDLGRSWAFGRHAELPGRGYHQLTGGGRLRTALPFRENQMNDLTEFRSPTGMDQASIASQGYGMVQYGPTEDKLMAGIYKKGSSTKAR